MKAGEIIKEKVKIKRGFIEEMNKKMRELKTDLTAVNSKLFGPSNVEKEKAAAAAQKNSYIPGLPRNGDEPKYAITILDENGKKSVDTEAWLVEEKTDKKHMEVMFDKFGIQEGLSFED